MTSQVNNKEQKNHESDDNISLPVTNNKYIEAMWSLLYFANATRPDILYIVNVLSRHQVRPTENE